MKKTIILGLLIVGILVISGCAQQKYVCSDGSIVSEASLCPKISEQVKEKQQIEWCDTIENPVKEVEGTTAEGAKCLVAMKEAWKQVTIPPRTDEAPFTRCTYGYDYPLAGTQYAYLINKGYNFMVFCKCCYNTTS